MHMEKIYGHVMISSSAEVGNYSLEIMTLEPALPDLEVLKSHGDAEGEDTGTWTEFNLLSLILEDPGNHSHVGLVHAEDSTVTYDRKWYHRIQIRDYTNG